MTKAKTVVGVHTHTQVTFAVATPPRGGGRNAGVSDARGQRKNHEGNGICQLNDRHRAYSRYNLFPKCADDGRRVYHIPNCDDG